MARRHQGGSGAGVPAQGKRPRRRPIRLRITALLLVPLLSLIGLWGFAASITLGDALDKYDFSATYEKMALPGIYLVNQLQTERQLSVVALSAGQLNNGDGQEKQRLAAQRKRSDGVQAAFRRSALSADARDAADAKSEQRLATAIQRLDGLPALRSQVDSGRVETLQVIDAYSIMLDNIIQVF